MPKRSRSSAGGGAGGGAGNEMVYTSWEEFMNDAREGLKDDEDFSEIIIDDAAKLKSQHAKIELLEAKVKTLEAQLQSQDAKLQSQAQLLSLNEPRGGGAGGGGGGRPDMAYLRWLKYKSEGLEDDDDLS